MDTMLRQCMSFIKSTKQYVKVEGDLEPDEQLQADFLDFSICIAAIDGTIDKQELYTIAKLLGIALDNEFQERVSKLEKNPLEVLSKVPLSIKYFIQIDRAENPTKDWLNNTRYLYKTFKQIGCVIIACNGSRLPVEVDGLNRFTDTVIKYIAEEETMSLWGDFNKEKEKKEQEKKRSKDFIDKTNQILEDVNGLIGLENVKKEINNLVNLLLVYKYREERGMKNPPLAMHFVFTGNPGTGKTTIARMIAKIYKELGIIEKDKVVEVDRTALVAGYVGQTGEKVHEVVKRAMGGVLFIDEAYTLTNNSENDFGREAIDILLKLIEDNRDKFITIVAGYPNEMEEFLESNPGLRSRFNKRIEFVDYNAKELVAIFEKMCKEYDYVISDGAKVQLENTFATMIGKRNFANAREVRNYFERTVNNHANRVLKMDISNNSLLQVIDEADLGI